MGVGPTDGARPSGWLVPLALVAGAAVGLLLGVFLDAVAVGIGVGAGLGLVAGAAASGVAGTGTGQRRPAVLWVALAILVVGGTAMVLTWLR